MRESLLGVIFAAALALPGCARAPDPAPTVAPSSSTPAPPSAAAIVPPSLEAAPRFRARKRTGPGGTRTGKPITEQVYLYTRSRNPVDASGRTLFARADDTCFYETPMFVPPGENPPLGWRGRDRTSTDCPPAMDDPTWDECSPGEIFQDPASGRCMCEAVQSVMGPSTPRNAIVCPK